MSDSLDIKIKEYKAALEQDPKSTQFVPLCDAYIQLGKLDDALEAALKGAWESPQLPTGYVAVGRVYYQRQVQGKAEEAFFKALSLDQMCIPAYKGLARIYKDNGDLEKASDTLTKAIMLDPGDMSLQKMIESLSAPAGSAGDSVERSAQPEEPVPVQPVVNQEQAMDQKSDGMAPITTATIADIYIEQGLYEKALEVYRELLTEHPQDVAVQQKISELEALMASGSIQAATQDQQPVVAPSASFEESPPVESTVGSNNDTVIEKLNGWLEAIQARRNRV